jgi:hypothetical protein
MREDTVTTKVYSFDELSDEAKQAAIEKLYDINVDYEWWDSDFEDVKAIATLMGIEIEDIYFSGFSSQGDGACFTGYYSYAKQAPKKVKDYAPQDEELHRIALALQTAQRSCFYGLQARIEHRGHYSHEYCTTIDISTDDYYCLCESTDDDIQEALRDYMRWIYRQLRSQHEYLTSEEAIIEAIEANEYEFTEDGKLY